VSIAEMVKDVQPLVSAHLAAQAVALLPILETAAASVQRAVLSVNTSR
jgi:hypothetical protein